MLGRVALALHGGAGIDPHRDYGDDERFLETLADGASRRLRDGESALEVVVAVVAALEASGRFIAGRGAWPNTAGQYELDAAVMDGATQRAGAVAALMGYRSPVTVAQAVMGETGHCLLAGGGARAFAHDQGFAAIDDPETWFTPAGEGEVIEPTLGQHGTVGCVALDLAGRLAGATSTGGTLGKRPGRVGDTPIIGAGLWADGQVAVACTGLGEYFLRTSAAARVAHRMEFAGADLQAATHNALAQVARLGGAGGMVAIDAQGEVSLAYLGAGLKSAVAWPDGQVTSHIVEAPRDAGAARRVPHEAAPPHAALRPRRRGSGSADEPQ